MSPSFTLKEKNSVTIKVCQIIANPHQSTSGSHSQMQIRTKGSGRCTSLFASSTKVTAKDQKSAKEIGFSHPSVFYKKNHCPLFHDNNADILDGKHSESSKNLSRGVLLQSVSHASATTMKLCTQQPYLE